MDLVKAITLGVIQGLTEFLPISSTAHLKIVPALLGWKDPGAAPTAVIQLGTVTAVIAYFARDLAKAARGFFTSLKPGADRSSLDARVGWAVVLGTVPICVVGLAGKNFIEGPLRSNTVIAVAMIVGALALYAAEMLTQKKRAIEDITIKDGVTVGIAQAFALIPGMSRSGSTLIGAFLTGLNREAAARFSFLLSVPAVVLSGLLELKDLNDPLPAGAPPTMNLTQIDIAVATVVAGVVGYASIAFLLKFLRTHTTLAFVVYRIGLGVLLLYLISTGKLLK